LLSLTQQSLKAVLRDGDTERGSSRSFFL